MVWTLLAGLVPLALADDGAFEGAIDEAREAIFAEDWSGAAARLDAAEAAAAVAETLLLNTDIARIPFYRGALAWHDDDHDAAMRFWRQAAAMAPTMQPEAGVLDEPETRDTYHAIVEEVLNGTEVGINVPDDASGAVYLDGVKREPGDTIALGIHLVQVRCEDLGVMSAWHDYGTPPKDYFVLCSGGAYDGKVAKKATKETESDDIEDLDAPVRKHGGGSETTKTVAGVSLLGLSLVGGGATIYTYGRAAHYYDSYAQLDAATPPGRQGKTNAFYDTYVLPSYRVFYVSAGATGLLVAGGITLIVLDVEGPGIAPLPGGGGMLGWSGRF